MLTATQVRAELLAGIDDALAQGQITAARAEQRRAEFAALTETELLAIRDRVSAFGRALLAASRSRRRVEALS